MFVYITPVFHFTWWEKRYQQVLLLHILRMAYQAAPAAQMCALGVCLPFVSVPSLSHRKALLSEALKQQQRQLNTQTGGELPEGRHFTFNLKAFFGKRVGLYML